VRGRSRVAGSIGSIGSIGILAWASVALAADGAPAGGATTAADTAPLPVVPSSPAFDAIGASPTAINRPTTLRALGTDLLSTIDQTGHFQTGVAIEAAPFWLMFGDRITLKQWREDYGARSLSRLALSVASSANSANGITQVAQGLRFTFWDESDPRFDEKLEHCIVNQLPAPPKAPPTPPKAPEEPLKAGADAKKAGADTDVDPDFTISKNPGIAQCKQSARDRIGEGDGGAVAFAITEQTASTASSAQLGKIMGWASFKVAFGASRGGGSDTKGGAWGSAVFSGRYSYSKPDKLHEVDLGTRIRAGSDWLGASIDFTWTPYDATGSWSGSAFALAGAAELRVANTTWVVVTTGGRFGTTALGPQLFSILSFRYALSDQRTIVPVVPSVPGAPSAPNG
jgi:hypothetical protein